MVDETTTPRIMIIEKVSGGTGGLLQAFDRLDVLSGRNSLWGSLQETVGRCPIADGEKLVSSVLQKATTKQLITVQQDISLNSVRKLLLNLKLEYTEDSLVQYLTRMLAKTAFITEQEQISPSLIRQELILLQDELRKRYDFPVSNDWVLNEVVKSTSEQRPRIERLRKLLDDDHQLFLQLKALSPNQCKDGCTVCVGVSSDIAPKVVSHLFNSRSVLATLREELNCNLPSGNLEDVQKILQEEGVAIVNQRPPTSADALGHVGIECFPHLDEKGQVTSATSVVVNRDLVNQESAWKYEGKESKKYPLRNGVYVRSRAEYVLGDQLMHEGIPFKYEPEIQLIDTKTMEFITLHPDFLVFYNGQKIYIEYWGLTSPEYLKSRKRKEELYRTNSEYKLLSLEPNDVENKIFLRKLKEQFGG